MSENIDFKCAPVLLIGFNRPERLAAQVERVRAVKPSRLFIAVDGPRVLGGWIVSLARWVERRLPCLFRI